MKAKQREQVEDHLTNEVAVLRDQAARSSDPIVVAKAIAASDEGVQQLLVERLCAGERLAEVFALDGIDPPELQVFFRFTGPGKAANLTDSGVLAFVDTAGGAVIGTVDPFVLQPERRAGRPFVTVGALGNSEFAATNDAIAPMVKRELDFFQRVGLGGFAARAVRCGCDTVTGTRISSTTWSGQPYRPDDSGAEGTWDPVDSPGPIVIFV